jgi:D-alanyl-lipoteichoic acid acyltransferase DltB (MBOAT superfamily)
MGYNLMQNFRQPYFAVTVADFWRRWHISLSTWFRDYVYIPLGGSRVSKLKLYRNLLVTFLVSGLWHGAAYNFVIWGGYHAVNQMLAKILKPHKNSIWDLAHINETSRFRKVVDITLTFILVSYGWMIFYAPNVDFIIGVTKGYLNLGMPYIHQTTIFFFVIGLLILCIHDIKQEIRINNQYTESSPIKLHLANYIKYVALTILIVWIGVLGGGQFIYFQF